MAAHMAGAIASCSGCQRHSRVLLLMAFLRHADLSQAMDKAMQAIGREVAADRSAVSAPQHSDRERQLLERIAELEQQLAAAR